MPSDVGQRHQANGVAKRLRFARPMMRRGAGFDTNQARRQLLEEGQDVASLQLAAEDHLATGINAVHLKYRLGKSRPIVVTACMGSSKRRAGMLNCGNVSSCDQSSQTATRRQHILQGVALPMQLPALLCMQCCPQLSRIYNRGIIEDVPANRRWERLVLFRSILPMNLFRKETEPTGVRVA